VPGAAPRRIPERTLRTVKLVKRIVIGLVIAFAVFYLVTRPQESADAVQGLFGAVFDAGAAVVDFFSALAAG